jgi:hypothetical protein
MDDKSDKEKNEKIEKEIKNDLGISEETDKEITKKIQGKIKRKELIKKIRWSIIAICVNISLGGWSLYNALNENNNILLVIAYAFFGLTAMEIFKMYTILKKKNTKDKTIRYCAQITDSPSKYPNILKQEIFPSFEEAREWVFDMANDGDSATIVDLFDGRIVAHYENRIKDVEKWERDQKKKKENEGGN